MKTPVSSSSFRPKRPFSVFLLICCVLACAVTARLGIWQLDRAKEKTAWAESIAAISQQSPWTAADFKIDPRRWQERYHPVALQGEWRPDLSFYLGNRTHQGGIGFWVFTPLVLSDGSWVLVKRGWAPRHPIEPNRPPLIAHEAGLVTVMGRIDDPPSQWMTLTDSRFGPAQPWPESKILDNVDLETLAQQWQQDIRAVVLQTDTSTSDLRRDWPAVDLKVDTHWAYALQWFALSLTSLLLYLWYQWFKPFRKVPHD